MAPGGSGPSLGGITSTLPPSPVTLPLFDQRLKDLFPPGFDSNFASSSLCGPNILRPDQLYRILTDRFNRDTHRVEHTIVKSAWYAKQAKSARHEFILVEVQDTTTPDLTNYVVLDRNKGERSPRVSKFMSKVLPPLLRIGAKDVFRVSYDGDVKKLLHDCQLESHTYLEQINFQPEQPLLLYELATLAYHVSDRHPKYNPVDANCYWFAGLIWECMLRMRPKAEYINQSATRRGKFGWVRYRTNPLQVREISRDVEERISTVRSELFGQYVMV